MPSPRSSLSLLGLLFLALAPFARGVSFSSVVVYGDSLSDNGNVYALTGQPGAPYYMGRRSDGPVAVEQLNSDLHSTLYDFAFIGATSGTANYASPLLPGMKTELFLPSSQALLASPLVSSSLFVVWGGANDFLVGDTPQDAVSNINFIVANLIGDGATHILVPGVPDLGLTPDLKSAGLASAGTLYSQAFNTLLQSSLSTVPDATYVDTFNLLHNITDHPMNYGLTDVTDPCFTGTTLCSNPGQYLFFDGFHPTTAVDTIVANQFAAAAGVTPEPSAIVLTLTGLGGLLPFTARMRRKRQAAGADLV